MPDSSKEDLYIAIWYRSLKVKTGEGVADQHTDPGLGEGVVRIPIGNVTADGMRNGMFMCRLVRGNKLER